MPANVLLWLDPDEPWCEERPFFDVVKSHHFLTNKLLIIICQDRLRQAQTSVRKAPKFTARVQATVRRGPATPTRAKPQRLLPSTTSILSNRISHPQSTDQARCGNTFLDAITGSGHPHNTGFDRKVCFVCVCAGLPDVPVLLGAQRDGLFPLHGMYERKR